jgi:hypothetical protein
LRERLTFCRILLYLGIKGFVHFQLGDRSAALLVLYHVDVVDAGVDRRVEGCWYALGRPLSQRFSDGTATTAALPPRL